MIAEKLKVYHGFYMDLQIMLDTDLRPGDFLSINVFRQSPLKLSHFSLLITAIISLYRVKYHILICLHCIKIK